MSQKNANIAKLMEEFVPFNHYLGFRVTEISEGFVRMEVPYKEEFIGDPRRPALHGGLISTVADTCGGGAVWSMVEENVRISTVDLRMDFLRPGPPENLVCEASVVRIGNMVGVADMRLFAISNPERTIATGKGVYNIKHPEKK